MAFVVFAYKRQSDAYSEPAGVLWVHLYQAWNKRFFFLPRKITAIPNFLIDNQMTVL
jgi:hypothetical protein